MKNARIPLSVSQINGFKRAVQLFKKAAKSSNLKDLKFVNDLKLSDIQNEIAKALHYGSYNELNAEAKKTVEVSHIDCENIGDDKWISVRRSICHRLGIDSSTSSRAKDIIFAINWYPMPDEQLSNIGIIADKIISVSDDMMKITSLSEADENNYPSYKDSKFLSFSHYDLRYVHRIVRSTANDLDLKWFSLSNGVYVIGTCALSLVQNMSSFTFQLTQLGHHNNKFIMPLVALGKAPLGNVIVFREFTGYIDTYLSANDINKDYIQVSHEQSEALVMNSILEGSLIEWKASA